MKNTFPSIHFNDHHEGADRLELASTRLGEALENFALGSSISHLKSIVTTAYAKWQAKRAAAHADEAMWTFAHQDPRLMAEIQAALSSRN